MRHSNAPREEIEREFIDVLAEREPAILEKLGLVVHRKNSIDEKMVPLTTYITRTPDEEAEFRKLCVDTVDLIRSKKSLTFMCAVDGSDASDIAFKTMMQMKRRLDHVCLFHAYSKAKDPYLPQRYQKDFLMQHYEAELLSTYRIPLSRFTFFWTDRKGKSVKEVVLHMMEDFKGVRANPMAPTAHVPNFFFMGYVGRKGPKDRPSVLGSVTDISLRNVHMPCVITKQLCIKHERYFVIAVDGSPLSKRGFDMVFTLINPRDKVGVVHVINPRRSGGIPPPDDIEHYYEVELEKIGTADCKFRTLVSYENKSIGETIVDYVNDTQADFVSIAPRTRPDLSSVTEHVIAFANCNVILCKN